VNPDVLPKTGPDLVSYAENIAAYVTDHFTANNVALPTARRIAPGQLSLDAWDCEQFSVGTGGIIDAAGGTGTTALRPRVGTPASVMTYRAVSYMIQIVRCAGSCTAAGYPSNEETDAAGRQMLVDMALLSQALVNVGSAPPDWAPKNVPVDVGPVAPLGPTGAFYAIEASIAYSVEALLALPDPVVL
jgi:hypothetical protein